MKTTIAILTLAVTTAAALTLASCQGEPAIVRNNTTQTPTINTQRPTPSIADAGTEKTIIEKGPEVGAEIDTPPGPLEVGDIIKDITNPITGARAYEEMQEVPGDVELESRVIVEYRSKRTEMKPVSAILEFSPNGEYLLYVYQSAPENAHGMDLYSIETGKTQELIPSVRESDPRYEPSPDARYIQWGNGKITYTRFGRTVTLTYKEE